MNGALVNGTASLPATTQQDPSVQKLAEEPLNLAGIAARRAKAGKLIAGTAAYSDSDMFKSPHAFDQPKAKRWDHILTDDVISRQPCALKQAARFLKKPGMLSLGGGLPSSDNFPIESISMHVPQAPLFDKASTETPESIATIGKHDIRDKDGVFDLAVGLNYGQSIGSAQMLRWVTEHTELVSRPPYADWRCALSIGSTGALDSALRMFCDRNRRDSVLTEEYSFSTALETIHPLGIKIVGVRVDEQGLLPDSLDETLSSWDEIARGARKPTVLYTVPSGQNPTGATMGAQRRQDVYNVCRKHDIFIFEDEPYYYLQMPPYDKAKSLARPGAVDSSSNQDPEEFLKTLIPTMLSIDIDGRVLRMDSFSKVIIPGSRMGWITASEQVIERYIRLQECVAQGPSGLSQVLLYKLLDETWGHDGYLRWLVNLRSEYTRRRDTLLDACEKYLPKDVVSWTPPTAGMFHWLHVDHSRHPHAGQKTILEIEEEIFDSCVERGVLACRGSWFSAERDVEPTGLFFRTTFAAASQSDMDVAVKRLGEAIRASFEI
ncbi:aromatic amino acid aminotransferase-like protein [Xylaria bambusicola]|uniref:aromatic amino acid aminotransferase-like protein n=1 Tax=Xylaria bambusicola TaxID=326684 RepID=UPI0020082DD1|nr:aromatic amino acid aminotransferase-like protein [Xylaria bambusicola]KAI0515298.1 aromatic amino acid aminotransferase-like protein [Xylaria bambusicola]